MWHAAMLCMPTTRAQSCLFVWWRELAPARPHLPEPSGSHPAPGAGWPRVTHVREEGVRRQAPKWAFFHQCYVTWQFHLLCVKDWPDWFWGGAERKRTAVTVARSHNSADVDEVEGGGGQKTAGQELQ